MKPLFRLLLVLAFLGLVGWGLYVLGETPTLRNALSTALIRPERFREPDERVEFFRGRPEGFREGGPFGEGRGERDFHRPNPLRGLIGLLGNLFQVAVILTMVVLMERGWHYLYRFYRNRFSTKSA